MDRRTVRVLVVDDYEAWRRYICSTIEENPAFRVIAEAADGLEAVRLAEQLLPDLIFLDIGLPTLNGIEAARIVRDASPGSKIVFVSENRSQDIAEEALRAGAAGYVVKSSATSELLPAVAAVLKGEQFISAILTGPRTGHNPHRDNVVECTSPQDRKIPHHHEAVFYPDDQSLLDRITAFIGPALQVGNAAIVVATESHCYGVVSTLQARGLDIHAAIEQGRFITVHAADTLPMYMVDGMPDPVRYIDAFGDLIRAAEKAAKADHPRVAIYGEGVYLLWAQGNAEAAMQVENLCNQITRLYDVDILCGYFLGSAEKEMNHNHFEQICAEHSAVHSQ